MYSYPLPQEFPITSPFGQRINPVTGKPDFHDGVDLACPANTPVFAFDSGEVVVATKDQFGALWVDIKHNEGGLMTRYVHLNRLDVVRGQTVTKGQQIGLSGNTGQSIGSHLHFGTFVNRVPKNPQPFLNNSNTQFNMYEQVKTEAQKLWNGDLAPDQAKDYINKTWLLRIDEVAIQQADEINALMSASPENLPEAIEKALQSQFYVIRVTALRLKELNEKND